MSGKVKGKKIQSGRRRVRIKKTGKVLFPKSGITKGELIDYYRRISKHMLPFLKNRIVVMQAFPDGIGNKGFYQKAVPDYFPKWIFRTRVPLKQSGSEDYVVVRKEADLTYLADKAIITLHTWLSTADKIHYPDRMIFDLDPPRTGKKHAVFAAKMLKNVLERENLTPFLMLTGSRGLHVVVPLKQKHTFKRVRDYARRISKKLAKEHSGILTVEISRKKRLGRLFIDYLRNAYGQTTVAPYAVRQKEQAPVAFPIAWRELRSDFDPQKYTIKNIFKTLRARKDPWKSFRRSAAALA